MARDIFGNDLDVNDFIIHDKSESDDDTLSFGIISHLDPPLVRVLNHSGEDVWWLGGKIDIKDFAQTVRIPNIIINSLALEDILRQQRKNPVND